MTLRKLTTAAFALALAVSAAPALAQGLQAGQTFGDWSVQCPPEGQAQAQGCFIAQQVNNAQGKPVLQARVGKATQDGQQHIRLMLVGPLGVMLPQGVAVQVDQNEGHRVPFLQCSQMGCQTLITLTDKDIEQLKAGTTMKVGMVPPNGEMQVIPVSLKGFTAAIDALRK